MFGINTQVNWKYKLIHFENTLPQKVAKLLPWFYPDSDRFNTKFSDFPRFSLTLSESQLFSRFARFSRSCANPNRKRVHMFCNTHHDVTYLKFDGMNDSKLRKQIFQHRSSRHGRRSVKIAVLKKFAIFIGKNLCWSLFLIKFQT